MAFSEQSMAIAVIGATGSGKSTFINLASGSNLPVRKSLRSHTNELESSTFFLDGRTVTLIDTPGFENTAPTVLDVLKMISEYLSRLYSQGVKFAGVIYMHRASEDSMAGPSRRNFQSFCKFCGDTSLRDVVIVSNKPPAEDLGEAKLHDSAQTDEFFAHAVDNGAQMLSYDGSRASTHSILRHLINRKSTAPSPKSNQRMDPVRTTTGTDAVRELKDQVEHHTKAFGSLCRKIDAATLSEDRETKEVLHKEARSSLEKIDRLRYDLERLVANFAAENPRLEDENQQYRCAISPLKTEGEPGTPVPGKDRRSRELAKAERGEAEALLGEGRPPLEHGGLEECLPVRARPQYAKLFAGGTVVFALICVSRFIFDGCTL